MARLIVSFTGPTGKGSFSAPGVKAGDRVLDVLILENGDYGPAGGFISFAPSNDELIYTVEQDLSSFTLTALLDRDLVID
jgi:hypothetical protein